MPGWERWRGGASVRLAGRLANAAALRGAVLAGIAGATLVAALAPAVAQEALAPGQAFVTRFSGTVEAPGSDGRPRPAIDLDGPSGVALDLAFPGFDADGRHFADEPHLFEVTAREVGQVFGIALGEGDAPDVVLAATSAFGLHRSADGAGWMPGQWGEDGGPGTIYRLAADENYRPEIFAQVTLDGRQNTGAALGNIALDRWNGQLFVSDLETGMIHRFDLVSGEELGRFDHGLRGRTAFRDVPTGADRSLPEVAFDPATARRARGRHPRPARCHARGRRRDRPVLPARDPR